MNKFYKLREIQNLIQMSVQSRSLPQDLVHVIVEKSPINIKQRLHIYQDAYTIRLKESLRDDFPRIEQALHVELFDNLVDTFIKSTPSKYPNLAEYSALFLNYVEQKNPELLSLVYLDWYEILSMHVQEPKDQLSVTEIQQVDHFLVQLKPSTFIKQIGLSGLIVYRQNQEIKHMIEISPDLLALLFYLESKRSIDDLVKFSTESNFNFNFIIQELQKLIQSEIIYCSKPIEGESYV